MESELYYEIDGDAAPMPQDECGDSNNTWMASMVEQVAEIILDK